MDKNYKLLNAVNQHEFSSTLHDKPLNKETFFYEGDYL